MMLLCLLKLGCKRIFQIFHNWGISGYNIFWLDRNSYTSNLARGGGVNKLKSCHIDIPHNDIKPSPYPKGVLVVQPPPQIFLKVVIYL